MPVYKFSHHLLAVLVHLAHTTVKWKTNFLTLDVGDKLVNTDDTALMKYEKKFMQKAVSIMYTVFSFKKEHGRCFHPKSLLRRSKSHSLAPRLLYVSITLFSSLSQSLVMMQRRCICHRKDQVYCPFPLSIALQCGNGNPPWTVLTSSTQSPPQRNTSDMADIISSYW